MTDIRLENIIIGPFFSYLYKKQKKQDAKSQTHPYCTAQRFVFITLQQPQARYCHYRWFDTIITQTHRGRNGVNSWAAAAAGLSERYLTSFNLRVKRLRGLKGEGRASSTGGWAAASTAHVEETQRGEESWNKSTKGQFLSFFLENASVRRNRRSTSRKIYDTRRQNRLVTPGRSTRRES